MKKAKRYNEGGMSLEQMYPEAKITRAGPQPKPAELPPAKSAYVEMLRQADAEALKKSLEKAATPEYERKAEKFSKAKGGGGGGGGIIPLDKRNPYFKKGGMVSSASKRADGCCIKGKTKGKMV
jgi:hypothetical protein